MDDQTVEDWNDAAWANQEQEQRMLREDPGYFAFLKHYEEEGHE
jgi:hypothetical protein